MIHKVDHLVITTSNMPACIAFYEALGFSARDRGDRWELFGGDFKINVHFQGAELEPKAAAVQVGSADLCFELSIPVAHCKRTLESRGISIELGVVRRHGVKGEMESVYLRDPDGNLVELCSYLGEII